MYEIVINQNLIRFWQERERELHPSYLIGKYKRNANLIFHEINQLKIHDLML